MSISSYYNKSATRLRNTESSTNEYGEPIFTESTTTFDCALQPNTTRSEGFNVMERGKVVVSTHVLYCAITIDISEGDIVTIDSEDYRVILVNDGAGREHHLECGLRLVN